MVGVAVKRLTKTFGGGGAQGRALSDISFEIAPGEIVALIGPSGSGKSTLLRNLSALTLGDRTDGLCQVQVGEDVVQQGGRVARDIRMTRRRIGFIAQQFNLVGRLSVLINVLAGTLGAVPAWRSLTMNFSRTDRVRALAALERVGIREHAYKRASQLSGGQQQRAAIARALVQRARVVLADEPIASLDPVAAKRVMEMLARINKEDGITVVVSLHQVEYALQYCTRVIALRAGEIVFDGPAADVDADLLRSIYGSEIGDAAGLDEREALSAPPFPTSELATSAELA